MEVIFSLLANLLISCPQLLNFIVFTIKFLSQMKNLQLGIIHWKCIIRMAKWRGRFTLMKTVSTSTTYKWLLHYWCEGRILQLLLLLTLEDTLTGHCCMHLFFLFFLVHMLQIYIFFLQFLILFWKAWDSLLEEVYFIYSFL